MKVRMLAYLQNDGSVQLIPVEDTPTVVKSIVTNAEVGTHLKFTVVETERSKLEKAPRIGSAYHVRRGGGSDDGFLTGDGLLDLMLLMEILDDGGYDYAPEWDEPVECETPVDTIEDTPVVESCGAPETSSFDDTTRSSSYESSSSDYSDSSSSYDSGSSDCGGGDSGGCD